MPTLRVNDLAPRVQYVADGAQTAFTVPFFFFDAADLQVRFDDGAEAAAHAVDGAGDPEGGAVLFDDPPPAGTRVTIWREMALERGTEFQEAGAFRAATINDELDRLAMLAQELSGRIERAPAFPATATAAPVAIAAPAAGKYLRWSADGLGLESVQPLDASAVAVSAFGESLLDDADAAAARATLGLPAALQNGAYSYAAAAGAPDAIQLTPAPPLAAYTAGQMLWFKAAANNTGPVTLAVSGLAAKAVQKRGGALAANDIRAGDIVEVVYDGAQFQMTSPQGPRACAFLAYNSADDPNQTGSVSEATVGFNMEVLDRGGDFSSNTFIAPVSGVYQLNAKVTLSNFGAGATQMVLRIVTSSRIFEHQVQGVPTTNLSHAISLSTLADMDAGDTAHVTIIVTGMAGETVSIKGGATGMVTTFSGYVVA